MIHLRSKGSLFIVGFIALYSIVHWAWMISENVDFIKGLFYQAGAISLICMSFAILLSIRPKKVEDFFGGLDRMYQVHKWLGIVAMLCFTLHFGIITAVGGGGDDDDDDVALQNTTTITQNVAAETAPLATTTTSTPETKPAETSTAPQTSVEASDATQTIAEPEKVKNELIDPLGLFPMVGFFLLIILTLNRKFAYHRWIHTHLLMGVLFAAVCYHSFLALQDGHDLTMTSLPGMMILLTIATGLLAYIYKQTIYRTTQRHPFTLVEVNALERATEVVLAPKNQRFAFEPGQFAFLKIKNSGFSEYHPFTISSGTKDGNIRFTMKVLGDYTRRVRDQLEPGSDVLVEGPYGRFNPLKDSTVGQVWIAGGIGITPFLATLRTMNQGHGKNIDVFYCVREEAEALFLEEIYDLARNLEGIKIHLQTSDSGGRLTADHLAETVGKDLDQRNFYFCGPKPMLNALQKGLKAHGVSQKQIHFEEFEMR